mgnify:CR=1 FL=1
MDWKNFSPLACAYARARGADRMSSFGDFISLSDVCDKDTALLIKREVSDGVIAPGYTEEALEILKQKKKGNYNVIQIDENFVPAPLEHKEVFGVTFEQGRQELEIDDAMLSNIVTENKELTEEAKRDMKILLIILEIYTVQLCMFRKRWTGYRCWCRTAVTCTLYKTCRTEGRQLVPSPVPESAESAI